MERIRCLFPQLALFTEPSRVLVVDFWAKTEETPAADPGVFQQMGDLVASLRADTELMQIACTEEQIYRLPEALAEREFDGLVLLPPFQRDQGARAILTRIRDRIQASAMRGGEPARPLFADEALTSNTLPRQWSCCRTHLTHQAKTIQ